MSKLWKEILGSCPLCRSSSLDAERVGEKEYSVTCLNCQAQFKVSLQGDPEIQIQNLGRDPRKTGLQIEELRLLKDPYMWKIIEQIGDWRYKPQLRPCSQCGNMTLTMPMSFRIGKSSRVDNIIDLAVLGTSLIHIFQDNVLLDMAACTKCGKVEFYLPQRVR